MKRLASIFLTVLIFFCMSSASAFAYSSAKVIKVYAGNGYTIGLCSDGSVKFAGEYYGKCD